MALKKNATIRVRDNSNLPHRPVVSRSLGPNFGGAAFPKPDYSHGPSVAHGARKRFLSDNGPQPRDFIDKLRAFTSEFCQKHFKPFESGETFDFDIWLSKTNYSESRKRQLRDAFAKVNEPGGLENPKHKIVKSFVKDEAYPEYKYPRLINARVDEAKVQMGPFFKCVEEVVFKLPCFVKKIAVVDRPRYIYENVYQPGAYYFATDYSQFEAHFKRELMESVEFVLYEHMLKEHPKQNEIMSLLRLMLLEDNEIKGKLFTAKVNATRMSGEMNTSLGNGFSNMILMSYLESIGKLKNLKGVYEGDDGLSSSTIMPPDTAYLKSLGLNVKLELHESLETAKFCGLTFDPISYETISDPVPALLKFGWSKASYVHCGEKTARALVRSKAMSLYSEFAHCPILSVFAYNMIRLAGSRYTTDRKSVV